MKVAFACWESRIAPVFDVAQKICLLEMTPGRQAKQTFVSLDRALLDQRAHRLFELGIDILVCGAISRPLFENIKFLGIQVISFVSGNLDDVIQAWMQNRLDADDFRMPGCGAKRGGKRFQGRFRKRKTVHGPAGFCRCSGCGARVEHERGVPCLQKQCPHCGGHLVRE